jgi:cyclase
MTRHAWTSLLLAAALAVAGSARAQGRDSIRIEAIAVAPGVHMLIGAGGNIGVSSGPDGVLLVDGQSAAATEKIRAAVAALGDRPLRFLLNTHWHGDHTGGNENWANAGAVIVAHDNVYRRMSAGQDMPAFGRKVPPAPAKALPVVTFNDSLTFHLNGEEIRVFHVGPAHTDGDAIVWFTKANVVHTGDLFFNRTYPFIDVASGGSIDSMIAVCSRILPLLGSDTKVIPGHGPLSDREGLRAYRDMLATVRDRMKRLVKDGKTLEQVQAAKPTAGFDEVWGQGWLKPEQFVGIVYSDLSRPARKK